MTRCDGEPAGWPPLRLPPNTIGRYADSGNTAGTPAYLDFQIHPDNGAAVPPVDYLGGWLEEARAKVLLVCDRSGLDGLPPMVAPPAAGSASVA